MFKQPQTDIAAERAVLAGICQYHSESYFDVCDIIKPESFSLESNTHIFQCLQNIFSKDANSKADYLTIVSSANEIGLRQFFEQREEQNYLRAILNSTVKHENVRANAIKVRKLHLAKIIVQQQYEAIDNVVSITGSETVQHIISLAEKPIFDLTNLINEQGVEPIQRLGEGAEEYVVDLMDNPREIIGIQTGFNLWDLAIGGGLMPEEVDIVAARLKGAKSFFGDAVGNFISDQLRIPVFNVDTEMSKKQHLWRVLANMAGLKIDDIKTGKCGKNAEDREKLIKAAQRLKNNPYYYESVCGMSFEDTLSIIRRWIVKDVGLNEFGYAKPAVIIFDYFKTMDATELSDNMREYQLLGFKLMLLKDLCKKYKISCLALAQTSREGITKEDTGIIGDSDRIARYASSTTLLKDKSDEEIQMDGDKSGNKKLVVLAARNGPGLETGNYINIKFDGAYGRMTEGKTHFELQSAKNTNKSFETEKELPTI